MTATMTEPLCPVCNGKMWDNRDTKRNPKAPDFKCRDRSCEGVIWPPKPGTVPAHAMAPAPVSHAKQGYTVGAVPGLDDGSEALPHEKLDGIFRVYGICFKQAHTVAKADFGPDVADDTVAAMAATLLIAAQKAGVV